MTLLIRPLTLEERQSYVLQVHRTPGFEPVYLPVRFISYQPCPALIKVVLLEGDKSSCIVRRDDLYIDKSNLPKQKLATSSIYGS